MEERRRQASAHSDIEKGKEWRRNAEPEVSIDLDKTNERRLILRRRHPPAEEYSCGRHLQKSTQRH